MTFSSALQDLHSHVVTQTAQSFVTSFLTRCIRVHAEHIRRNPLSIPVLPAGAIIPKYAAAYQSRSSQQKVLFLIDFESTLWTEDPRVTREHGFVPPQRVVDMLDRLVKGPKNEVWILSGLPVKSYLEKIVEAVPGLGVV
jgi:trehalose 6-phosphate synthase/phosphatase